MVEKEKMKCILVVLILLSIFVTFNVSLKVPRRLLGEKRTIIKASLQDEKVNI